MITALMMNAPLHQKTAKWPQAGSAGGTRSAPAQQTWQMEIEIKRLLEKHIEYPVDYLPDQPAEYAGAED